MGKSYKKINSKTNGYSDPGLSLHNPLTVWYMLTRSSHVKMAAPKCNEDIRIETTGQWTHGMHVVERQLQLSSRLISSLLRASSDSGE